MRRRRALARGLPQHAEAAGTDSAGTEAAAPEPSRSEAVGSPDSEEGRE